MGGSSPVELMYFTLRYALTHKHTHSFSLIQSLTHTHTHPHPPTHLLNLSSNSNTPLPSLAFLPHNLYKSDQHTRIHTITQSHIYPPPHHASPPPPFHATKRIETHGCINHGTWESRSRRCSVQLDRRLLAPCRTAPGMDGFVESWSGCRFRRE
jgi:hypothetical protein